VIEKWPDKDLLLHEMQTYFGNDRRRIEHAHRVTAFAEQLFQSEGGNYGVIIAAAVFHDIGIHEAERKHGSTAAHYQELEGPPIARSILKKVGVAEAVIDEACHIIAHHHHPGVVNTLNFRVLYDADMLVNLADGLNLANKEKLARVIERVFLTPGGKELAKRLYL
jgi:HD superfamily phosphodiesterase